MKKIVKILLGLSVVGLAILFFVTRDVRSLRISDYISRAE